MTAAQTKALEMAQRNGVACYVNEYPGGVLLVDAHKNRLCSFVAYPDGSFERVVQGYSHSLAMAQKQQEARQ